MFLLLLLLLFFLHSIANSAVFTEEQVSVEAGEAKGSDGITMIDFLERMTLTGLLKRY